MLGVAEIHKLIQKITYFIHDVHSGKKVPMYWIEHYLQYHVEKNQLDIAEAQVKIAEKYYFGHPKLKYWQLIIERTRRTSGRSL